VLAADEVGRRTAGNVVIDQLVTSDLVEPSLYGMDSRRDCCLAI